MTILCVLLATILVFGLGRAYGLTRRRKAALKLERAAGRVRGPNGEIR